MRKINFTKMVASGNDFVVIENRKPKTENRDLSILSQKICNRKYGVGADGLLVLEPSKKAEVRMRIFNADGSEAEMCGNGARCIALWEKLRNKDFRKRILKIETKAGIIDSQVAGDDVKIKLTDPKEIRLDIPLKVNNRNLKVNFINTGVPHVIIFVEGLGKIDVCGIGRQVRYHKEFAPQGANVNFIEILGTDAFKIRTYERGVEDETLACGTGTVASALIFTLKSETGNKIRVFTRDNDMLTVYFTKSEDSFSNVWLEGKVRIVYKGVYYV